MARLACSGSLEVPDRGAVSRSMAVSQGQWGIEKTTYILLNPGDRRVDVGAMHNATRRVLAASSELGNPRLGRDSCAFDAAFDAAVGRLAEVSSQTGTKSQKMVTPRGLSAS